MPITFTFVVGMLLSKARAILTAIPFKLIAIIVAVLIGCYALWSYKNLVEDNTELEMNVTNLQIQSDKLVERLAEIEIAETRRSESVDRIGAIVDKNAKTLKNSREPLSKSKIDELAIAGDLSAISKQINDTMHGTIDCIEAVGTTRECE